MSPSEPTALKQPPALYLRKSEIQSDQLRFGNNNQVHSESRVMWYGLLSSDLMIYFMAFATLQIYIIKMKKN